jgi:hypothetical protein
MCCCYAQQLCDCLAEHRKLGLTANGVFLPVKKMAILISPLPAFDFQASDEIRTKSLTT